MHVSSIARFALALCLSLLAAPAALAAPGYALRAIAVEGDVVPGSGHSYGVFLDVSINELGEVAFAVPFASGFPDAGVLVDSGSGPVLRFEDGDPPPPPLVDEYRLFGSYVGLDSSGRVSASAVVVELDEQEQVVGTDHGLFLDTAGTDSTVVVEGDAAPSPPTGTLDAQLVDVNYFSMNGAGDVAFESSVSGGSQSPGLFVRSAAGAVTLIAADGDTPVGGGPNSFQGFDFPHINAGGDVAFVGLLSGGSASQGVYVDAGGGPTTLALEGDVAPGTGGALFSTFFTPAQNASGDVVFMALLSGGTPVGGLFQASPALSALAVEGDVVPGAGPISRLASLPEIASDGSVALSLGFSSGPVSGGVYRRSPSGSYKPVMLAGETAPDTAGAVFSSFGFLGMNDAGQVAVVATLDDGRSGVFLATPTFPNVPVLPVAALPVLALLLVGTGIATRRSSRVR